MLYLFNYLAIFCARTSQKIKALLRAKMQINTIHYKSSTNMAELKDNSIKLNGLHPAIMPEQIPYRLIKMYSFVNDIVLDTFTGSGTTLKVAKELNRNYIGYEIYQQYKPLIEKKIN